MGAGLPLFQVPKWYHAMTELNEKQWHSHHWEANDRPDGGVSYGIGFTIAWQRGSLVEQGRNGAFLTDVLEACLDELEHKDSLAPCEENTEAIDLLESCLNSLRDRIERRKKAGIYGTHEPD